MSVAAQRAVRPALAMRPAQSAGSGPVFLHSMWRTGSSFLLSRFSAEPDYLAFYEPFNGEIGSRRLRQKAVHDYADRLGKLRHPDAGNSYFSGFDAPDPETGRPLWRFAHPRLPLHDVYNGLSAQGVALLSACIRVAEAADRVPVFGFCHSGVQIAAMRATFGGQHVYLSRAPREQFLSYTPLRNDFFIAATAMQMLCAQRWHDVAVALAPPLERYRSAWIAPFATRAPHWATMRVARRMWKRLDPASMYRLFYLSWLLSHRHAAQSCDAQFSLADLNDDAAARAQFEATFGIALTGISARHSDFSAFSLDFDALEAEVEAAAGDDVRVANPGM